MVPGRTERRAADLESVLGASPRVFESRILHHTDQARREKRRWRSSFRCPVGSANTQPPSCQSSPATARSRCSARWRGAGDKLGRQADRAAGSLRLDPPRVGAGVLPLRTVAGLTAVGAAPRRSAARSALARASPADALGTGGAGQPRLGPDEPVPHIGGTGAGGREARSLAGRAAVSGSSPRS
jgi:hypothetical protein